MWNKRNFWITGAAFVAMAVVFVAVFDWEQDEDALRKGIVVGNPQTTRTVPSVTSQAPIDRFTAPEVEEPEVAVVSEPEPPKEVTYEEAETAFHEKRYGAAVDLFVAYTDRKSENPWGFYMLGLSAWKAGDNETAESAFDQALVLDGRHVKSWINLSRVLLESSRPSEALARLDEALAIDPESNAAHRLRGRAFHQLGRVEEAVGAYRRAIQIDNEDAWSMNNLALIFIEEGRIDEALPPLARAVELRDDVAIFQNNLGMALERSGYFQAAEDAYARAVALDESYEKASNNLARLDGVLEDPELEPVDLAVIAQGFALEIDSWDVAAADNDQSELVDPVFDDVVVIDTAADPDSTEGERDR